MAMPLNRNFLEICSSDYPGGRELFSSPMRRIDGIEISVAKNLRDGSDVQIYFDVKNKVADK